MQEMPKWASMRESKHLQQIIEYIVSHLIQKAQKESIITNSTEAYIAQMPICD
jgi:hypothetical protein